jgi:hypothetical protein
MKAPRTCVGERPPPPRAARSPVCVRCVPPPPARRPMPEAPSRAWVCLGLLSRVWGLGSGTWEKNENVGMLNTTVCTVRYVLRKKA